MPLLQAVSPAGTSCSPSLILCLLGSFDLLGFTDFFFLCVLVKRMDCARMTVLVTAGLAAATPWIQSAATGGAEVRRKMSPRVVTGTGISSLPSPQNAVLEQRDV